MKILHVVPSFYPFVGGIESLVADLAFEQKESGLDPVVVFPDRLKKFPSEYSYRDFSVIPFSFPEVMIPWFMIGISLKMKHSPKHLAAMFANVRRIIVSEKPSIIHLHNASEIALPFSSIAKSLQIPLVLHWHTSVHTEKMKPVEKMLLQQSRNIIAVSEASRIQISSLPSLDEKIHIMPNGLRLDELPKRDINNVSNYIVMAGRFDLEKGFDLGVRAFAKVASLYPKLELLIAGNGPERKNLIELVENLGLANRIKFLGTLRRSDLYSVMVKSRCILIPTPFNEAFSLLAAEAMVMGVPTVATNIGGIPEVIDSGKTGLLANPDVESLGLAIRQLLDDFESAERLGIAAKEVGAKKFDIKRLNSSVLKLYQELV